MPTLTLPPALTELIQDLPNICGWESEVEEVMRDHRPIWLTGTNLKLEDVTAGYAIALHMHQPTIPAGWNGAPISNLQQMFEHPNEGDNHNAGPFAWCYSRMGDIIPELVHNGCNPRVMLDYSGNLLWGLRQMGRHDVLDNLKRITCDPTYQPYVEWLGTMWSHAVVPSTPIADIRLHIRAWQHHFAALFGWEALSRVRGFSPPEMHLPNQPDTLYEFVRALRDCGYRWVLIQEHTVETLEGRSLRDTRKGSLDQKHLPHRLVARNSHGETVSITALIKTQGSDTKLVGQMQPYYEAKTLSRQMLGGVNIPPLVSQIGDGENGGVMMNEFPDAFRRACYDMAGNGNRGTVAMSGTEYLELIEAAGCREEDFPQCQAIGQHRLWERVELNHCTPEAVAEAIAQIRQEDPNFRLEGASWTNHLSWEQGYENVLTPMQKLSDRFHQVMDSRVQADPTFTQTTEYRNALLYNLLLQTSCFRYWGQGTWTNYAQELYRRGEAVL